MNKKEHLERILTEQQNRERTARLTTASLVQSLWSTGMIDGSITSYISEHFNITRSDVYEMYEVATFYLLQYDMKNDTYKFDDRITDIIKSPTLYKLNISQLSELTSLDSYGDIQEILSNGIVTELHTPLQIRERIKRYNQNKERFK